VIVKLFLSCLPQFVTLIITLTGFFGEAITRSNAEQLGRFSAQGGANGAAVQAAAESLTIGVLSVVTFLLAFFTLMFDDIFSFIDQPSRHWLIILGQFAGMVEIGLFLQIILTVKVYELSTTDVARFLWFQPNTGNALSYSAIINRLSVSLLGLSLLVGTVKAYDDYRPAKTAMPPANNHAACTDRPATSIPVSGDLKSTTITPIIQAGPVHNLKPVPTSTKTPHRIIQSTARYRPNTCSPKNLKSVINKLNLELNN